MIVVVTGASGAIGKEICLAFAQKGESLCLVANGHYDVACDLAATIERDYGVRAVSAKADFARPEQVGDAMRYALAVYGHVDCLVNNAALSLVKPLCEVSPEEWQRVLAVNLTAPYLACQTLLPSMYHRGGCVVNVSSMWGTLGASCETAYAASKGGLDAFTKSLAQEYEGSVRVNALSLGFVDTPMNAHLSAAEKQAFFVDHPNMQCLSAAQAAEGVLRLTYGKQTGKVVKLGWK